MNRIKEEIDKTIELLSNWEDNFECYDIFCIQDVDFEESGDMDFFR